MSMPSPHDKSTVQQAVAVLASGMPVAVEPSDRLARALELLEWSVQPETLLRAGYSAGILVGVCCGLLSAILLSPAVRPVGFLVALSVGLLTSHLIHTLPLIWATARQTRALGAAPDLVARATLRMRLSPTPEQAAVFAIQRDDGLLAASLKQHIRQARGTGRSGLETFGTYWSERFPALERSLALIEAAGTAPTSDRAQLLDRALRVVLDGTSNQMQSFAARIRSPVTALYAFGVLLPTALVALLPAAGATGIGISPLSVVLLYNIVLPAVLVGAVIWLVSHRPVAFPPPALSRSHTTVDASTTYPVLAGTIAAIGGWYSASQLFPSWGPPIAAVGIGSGVLLWLWYHPVVAGYDRIEAIETDLSDALALIGRQVAHGTAVETALDRTASELAGPMGETLAEGVTQQQQLQMDVHEAFFGRYGVLDDVPSPRVRSSLAFLSVAAREGRPAGSALLALAEHLDDLQQVERDAQHALAHVTQTIGTTGALFGPLVAGVTVALAGAIGTEGAFGISAESLSWLGGPVGVYVLSMATILSALSVGLTRGFDRPLVGYRTGRALVCATVAYLCSYQVAGLLI